MAYAGRQFQSLRRSFRRSTRKRAHDFNESAIVSSVIKKIREDEVEDGHGHGHVQLAAVTLDDNEDLPSSMRLWAGCKNMDKTRDIVDDLDLFYVRQLAVSLQDLELQKKIDLEIKIREGTKKLLVACNREQQLLEASKSLVVSNARVLAYMSELQTRKTADYLEKKKTGGALSRKNSGQPATPCKGKIAVSDIRIPLFWKDVDHIRNRGDHHRYAVFCLLKLGTDIYDTQLVTNVDRTSTDVTFTDSFVFDNVSSDFQFSLEVYSYNLHDDMTIASTPQKIRRKINSFSNSVGKSVSRKNQMSLSTGSSEDISRSPPIPNSPKFRLVAKAGLTVDSTNQEVKTHDLVLENDESSHQHCLPLFGNICCQFAAQPDCTSKDLAEGVLYLQEQTAGLPNWRKLHGVLRDGHLRLYDKEDNTTSSEHAVYTIPISKNTSTSLSSKTTVQYPYVLNVAGSELEGSHHLAAESQVELEKWCKILDQLVLNQGAWRNACHNLNVIIPPEPRRLSFESDRTGSLYDEMSISPDLVSQDDSEDENVFTDPPATNLRSRNKSSSSTKSSKKHIFSIPKILIRRETNV